MPVLIPLLLLLLLLLLVVGLLTSGLELRKEMLVTDSGRPLLILEKLLFVEGMLLAGTGGALMMLLTELICIVPFDEGGSGTVLLRKWIDEVCFCGSGGAGRK